jgi:hypothetical protein
METINIIIALILKNYGVSFVVEKVTFDNKLIVYRLKRKKELDIFFWQKNKKVFYEYETNETTRRINFKSLEKVEEYLKVTFSEPEGFITDTIDM